MLVHFFGKNKEVVADYGVFCQALNVNGLPRVLVRFPSV
jgi:hypothetical protein